MSQVKTDDLHRPMSFYYLPTVPLEIRYRLDSKQRAENQTELDEDQATQLRGVIAGMNWAATQARPDLAAVACMIAFSFPTPKISHAKAANKAVQAAKARPFDMVLWAFPEEGVASPLHRGQRV